VKQCSNYEAAALFFKNRFEIGKVLFDTLPSDKALEIMHTELDIAILSGQRELAKQIISVILRNMSGWTNSRKYPYYKKLHDLGYQNLPKVIEMMKWYKENRR